MTTGDATDPPEQAYGNLTFLEENADTWNPAYRLHLDLGLPVILETSNYWILAAEKDSSGQIGLIITYSCGLFPGTDANAQIFFLSRYPYYYDTITYNSAVEKAKLGKKLFKTNFLLRDFFTAVPFFFFSPHSDWRR